MEKELQSKKEESLYFEEKTKYWVARLESRRLELESQVKLSSMPPPLPQSMKIADLLACLDREVAYFSSLDPTAHCARTVSKECGYDSESSTSTHVLEDIEEEEKETEEKKKVWKEEDASRAQSSWNESHEEIHEEIFTLQSSLSEVQSCLEITKQKLKDTESALWKRGEMDRKFRQELRSIRNKIAENVSNVVADHVATESEQVQDKYPVERKKRIRST